MKKIFNIRYTSLYLLIVSGLILAFFPDIISYIFYILGSSVIVYYIIKFIMSCVNEKNYKLHELIFGIIIGTLIIILPNFLSLGIPIVAGAFILVNGIERLIKAFGIRKGGYKWCIPAVAGVIFSVFGIYILANPKEISLTICRLIGVAILIIGIYKLAASLLSNKSNNNSDVIDIDDYKVD